MSFHGLVRRAITEEVGETGEGEGGREVTRDTRGRELGKGGRGEGGGGEKKGVS